MTPTQVARASLHPVDIRQISSHYGQVRRKPFVLLPLEISILKAGLDVQGPQMEAFHGFQLAKTLQELEGSRRLTAYGTLYKALGRLERSGFLASEWEDPAVAAERRRPRRRLYRVTAAGAAALVDTHRTAIRVALGPQETTS
jgi:hypothetical protein